MTRGLKTSNTGEAERCRKIVRGRQRGKTCEHALPFAATCRKGSACPTRVRACVREYTGVVGLLESDICVKAKLGREEEPRADRRMCPHTHCTPIREAGRGAGRRVVFDDKKAQCDEEGA